MHLAGCLPTPEHGACPAGGSQSQAVEWMRNSDRCPVRDLTGAGCMQEVAEHIEAPLSLRCDLEQLVPGPETDRWLHLGRIVKS